jgi:hypothetical protein
VSGETQSPQLSSSAVRAADVSRLRQYSVPSATGARIAATRGIAAELLDGAFNLIKRRSVVPRIVSDAVKGVVGHHRERLVALARRASVKSIVAMLLRTLRSPARR